MNPTFAIQKNAFSVSFVNFGKLVNFCNFCNFVPFSNFSNFSRLVSQFFMIFVFPSTFSADIVNFINENILVNAHEGQINTMNHIGLRCFIQYVTPICFMISSWIVAISNVSFNGNSGDSFKPFFKQFLTWSASNINPDEFPKLKSNLAPDGTGDSKIWFTPEQDTENFVGHQKFPST